MDVQRCAKISDDACFCGTVLGRNGLSEGRNVVSASTWSTRSYVVLYLHAIASRYQALELQRWVGKGLRCVIEGWVVRRKKVGWELRIKGHDVVNMSRKMEARNGKIDVDRSIRRI
jgi:hypothetical protein